MTPGDRALLDTWLAEVRRHPLLSREEERTLARRFREHGDTKARTRLVASNLRLVVKLAREHHRPPLLLMDLIQEGNLGLVIAVERFEPDRAVRLCTYAAFFLRYRYSEKGKEHGSNVHSANIQLNQRGGLR